MLSTVWIGHGIRTEQREMQPRDHQSKGNEQNELCVLRPVDERVDDSKLQRITQRKEQRGCNGGQHPWWQLER